MATPFQIPPLEVTVRKRDKVVYQGQAAAVSSVNQKGAFDILPEHANFITVIKDSLTIHKLDKTKEDIILKNGVMHSIDNKIAIYLDILTQVGAQQGANQPLKNLQPKPQNS